MTLTKIAAEQSLDEIEGVCWGESNYGSHLVMTCHALRKKPIGQFTCEDLRIMIGQGISLEFLIPLALNYLRKRPLFSGGLLEEGLLTSVCVIPFSYWLEHREQYEDFRFLVQAPIDKLRAERCVTQRSCELVSQLEAVIFTKIKRR